MTFKNSLHLFLIVAFIGCNSNSVEKTFEKQLGKKIVFPENLQYLNSNSNELTKSGQRLKLIIMLNGNCPKCIETINSDWYEYYFSHSKLIDFVFIMRTTNNQFFTKHILPNILIDGTYILDEQDIFMEINDISPNPVFHTFLLDYDNRTCVIGNPITNNAIGSLYDEKIQIIQNN